MPVIVSYVDQWLPIISYHFEDAICCQCWGAAWPFFSLLSDGDILLQLYSAAEVKPFSALRFCFALIKLFFKNYYATESEILGTQRWGGSMKGKALTLESFQTGIKPIYWWEWTTWFFNVLDLIQVTFLLLYLVWALPFTGYTFEIGQMRLNRI